MVLLMVALSVKLRNLHFCCMLYLMMIELFLTFKCRRSSLHRHYFSIQVRSSLFLTLHDGENSISGNDHKLLSPDLKSVLRREIHTVSLLHAVCVVKLIKLLHHNIDPQIRQRVRIL